MKLESVTCEYVCLSRLNQISCILFQIGPFFLYGINVSTELYSTIYIHLAYRSPIYCDRTNNLQYQKLYYIASFVERKSCAQPSHLITPPISVINMHVDAQRNVLYEELSTASRSRTHMPANTHLSSVSISYSKYPFQAHSSRMNSQVIKFIYCRYIAPLSCGSQSFTHQPTQIARIRSLAAIFRTENLFI